MAFYRYFALIVAERSVLCNRFCRRIGLPSHSEAPPAGGASRLNRQDHLPRNASSAIRTDLSQTAHW